MAWTTVAEGTSLDTLKQLVADVELGKGTPIRFEMTLNTPVAHLFDLAGAELIFKPQMPEGLDLLDVYSPDNQYQVVIDCEADPVHLLAIVAFVKAHWLAISLISIGIVFALGFLVTAIKIKAEVAWVIPMWLTITVVVVCALVAYLAYKGALPKLTAGGT